MARTPRDGRNAADGVRFVHEDDGSITAVDEETGVASYGDSKAEALRMLAEAIELHEGGGESVTDKALQEFGLAPGEFDDSSRDNRYVQSIQTASARTYSRLKNRGRWSSL